MRLAGFKASSYYVSESDKALRERLKEVHKPEKVSDDCTKFKSRLADERTLPVIQGISRLIHLYGSGFPCQAYSSIGKQQGSKDPRAATAKAVSWRNGGLRLMSKVVRRINRWLPQTFLLENVIGLLAKKNKKFFNRLLRQCLDRLA